MVQFDLVSILQMIIGIAVIFVILYYIYKLILRRANEEKK